MSYTRNFEEGPPVDIGGGRCTLLAGYCCQVTLTRPLCPAPPAPPLPAEPRREEPELPGVAPEPGVNVAPVAPGVT
jgi:hypothetical protein